MRTSIFYAVAASTVLYQSASASCAHGTSLHPRAEGAFKGAEFGYTDPIGPLQWSKLKPENSLCLTGTRQSPINLNSTTVAHDAGSAYKLTIADTPGSEFENLGTTVEVLVNGTLETALKSYKMKQFHFHSPSEHRLNEQYFAMESHFVFEAEDASIAVVSFLIDLGANQPELFGQVLPTVTNITKPGEVAVTNPLSFTSLIAHLNNNSVMRYVGSLTTPPCSESVDWIISAVPVSITPEIFTAAKSVIGFNSRFTQGTLGQPNLLVQATNGVATPIAPAKAAAPAEAAPAAAKIYTYAAAVGLAGRVLRRGW